MENHISLGLGLWVIWVVKRRPMADEFSPNSDAWRIYNILRTEKYGGDSYRNTTWLKPVYMDFGENWDYLLFKPINFQRSVHKSAPVAISLNALY